MKPTRVRWVVFGLGCGTSWLLYLHRYTFALIKSDLVKDSGLTGEQLGLLDATFSICSAAFQVPLGLVVDFLGAHVFLACTIGLWSAALAMHAWAPTLFLLGLARALLGAAQSAVFAALSRVTRNWFPASIRTTVQGWIGVFFARIGGFSANLLVATLLIGLLAFGWRSAVCAIAALGVLHAFLFLALYRNTPRQHSGVNAAEAELIEGGPAGAPAERLSFRGMVRRMSAASLLNLGFLCLEAAFSAVADLVYSNWIPLFLEKAHGFGKTEMGFLAALPLAGGALGGVAGGILNDRLIGKTGRNRWVRSLVGSGGKAAAALLLGLALLFYGQPLVFVAMLFAVKFCADVSLATRWGAVTDVGGRVTATVFATVNAAGIAATTAGSALYGWVIPQKAAEMAVPALWMPMFFIAIGMYAANAATWLLVNCTRPVLSETPPRS